MAEHPQVSVRRTVLEGPAADADLLVLGTTRRQGQFGLQLGRVSYTALHRAACPVAVVPHR